MIKLLVDTLLGNGIEIGVLRLVNYLSFRAIMGMVTSLLFALTIGFRFIVFLYRKKLRDVSGDISAIDEAVKLAAEEKVRGKKLPVSNAFHSEFVKEAADKLLEIDIFEIINAAKTKWNFVPHYPGAGVGGPCLPSNPYYLIQEAIKVDYVPHIIRFAREINDRMPHHLIELVMKSLNIIGKSVNFLISRTQFNPSSKIAFPEIPPTLLERTG